MAHISAALLVIFTLFATGQGLKVARLFTDHAVLQWDHPTIHGTGSSGEKVTVSVNGTLKGESTVGTDGNWLIKLPAMQPSFDSATVTIASGQDTIRLNDILFGDVWVCSGQSNMEFSVAEMFLADETIANADIPGLRLFAVQKNSSQTPVTELIDVQEGWVPSEPETICGDEYDGNKSHYCLPHCGPSAVVHSFSRPTWGYFSAVCFIHGRSLLRETNRPQGLLESCWGGTKIELWSGPNATAKCKASSTSLLEDLPAEADPEVLSGGPESLWNGMIVPLLNFPIRGAIWYQGEANANKGNLYYCQMKAMIQDWRANWLDSSNFTFIIHQLSAYKGSDGIPLVRWSQYGAAATLPGVGVSLGLDLADAGSPCGNVHIRNKTAVGERMALASLNLAYNKSVEYLGPFPKEISVSGDTITISYVGQGPLAFRSIPGQTVNASSFGFEVKTTGKQYFDAGSVSVTSDSTIEIKGVTGVTALRYAWAAWPASQLLFDSNNLLAASFAANCTTTSCSLQPYGNTQF